MFYLEINTCMYKLDVSIFLFLDFTIYCITYLAFSLKASWRKIRICYVLN